MIQIVRFKITQTTAAVTQFVKLGADCKLVGGKIWFSGTSAGATITVNKCSIDSALKSYLVDNWTPTTYSTGVAQSAGYTITNTATSEQLTKASGTSEKTPLLMNIGANAVITAGYMPFSAGDFLYVNVPSHVSEVPVFYIDLEFKI